MNKTTYLGDKPINRIGLGAMQLAGPGVFGPPRDPEAVRAVLRRAIELGVDHIDTAQYYGPDVVNDLIRDTLHPYPGNLKLGHEGWWPARRGRRCTSMADFLYEKWFAPRRRQSLHAGPLEGDKGSQ